MSTNLIQFPGRLPQWTFADRLRKVRRDAGWTLKQMAESLDVGEPRYAAWENGRNIPPNLAEVAVKLESVTGVQRTWFLGWADETPGPNGPGGTVGPVTHRYHRFTGRAEPELAEVA